MHSNITQGEWQVEKDIIAVRPTWLSCWRDSGVGFLSLFLQVCHPPNEWSGVLGRHGRRLQFQKRKYPAHCSSSV